MIQKTRITPFVLACILVLAVLAGAGYGALQIGSSVFASTPEVDIGSGAVGAPDRAAQAQQEPPTLPDQEILAQLYENLIPSVVNLQVTAGVLREGGRPRQPFPPDPFAPPEDFPRQGQGSGFMYDDQGHIVTNNHVVEGADTITVNFANGMWASAEVVARDPQADLAVVRVEPPEEVDWRPLPLAEDDALRVGHYVVAMGSPFGLDRTMTLGIVSAIGRSFAMGQAVGARYSLPDVIQTDAAINPGNSGGPLLNLNGEVVGVNFAINSPIRANAGVGFAIPVSMVRLVVPALIEEGAYAYPYLGIAGQTINAPVAEAAGIPENLLGVLVRQVVTGGPAHVAGVQVDDIIVGINDEMVWSFDVLISYLVRETQPGQEVTLTVIRIEETFTMDVVLGERPAEQLEPEHLAEVTIPISEAISIARDEVERAGLMTEIDTANARLETWEGLQVWVVSLTGNGNAATVIVNAQTGEVLELNLE